MTVLRHGPAKDAYTSRFKYDKLGRLRFSQDGKQSADGKITFLVYDVFARVTRIGEALATFSTLTADSSYAFETNDAYWKTKTAYDADSLGSGVNYAQGRLTKIEENTDGDTAADVNVLLAYDREGRIHLKQQTVDGLAANSVQYAYDLAGRVTKIVYPGATKARYIYDPAGRLKRVTDAAGGMCQ